MSNTQSFWEKFWKDKSGRITIWQTPNGLLVLWFVFMLVTKIASGGQFKAGSRFVSSAALFGWACLEVAKGDSYFRRVLGFIVLVSLVISHYS